MEDKSKQVVVYGVKPHRVLLRSIERQVEKWIEREQSLLFLPKHAEYRVEVEKEDTDPFFGCSLKIRIGSREWRSHEGGKTIQEAVSQALKRLRSPSELSIIPRGVVLKTHEVSA